MTGLYDIFLRSAGVSTDSRRVAHGSLFFALRGGSFDGNRFAAAALEAGAAYAVVDDPRIAVDDRYLVVRDTLQTLQDLAAHHRRELAVPVLAITGTNGKTTTKELTARVLSHKYKVSVTRGNLNNHIGVPLTLLAMPRDTEFGIVEMGAGAEGEIALLCRIADPDYGLITNVGRGHLEGFGSIDGVRRGKGELYDYLAARGGTAFVSAQDGLLVRMADEREGLQRALYGVDDVRGVESNLVGDYNRYNIAAAAAIGRYFGVGDEVIRAAIASYEPDNGRSQRMETGRNTLVLDCYNANPSSMAAAISGFAADDFARPKSLILGDMLELGAHSLAEHSAILELIAAGDFEEVYLVGREFSAAAAAFTVGSSTVDGVAGAAAAFADSSATTIFTAGSATPSTEETAGSSPTAHTTPSAERTRGDRGNIWLFPDVEALIERLRTEPLSDRAILIKGSNGMKLGRVVDYL